MCDHTGTYLQCKSCASTKHGMSHLRLYRIWMQMRVRCGHIAGASDFEKRRYRDRGIRVCEKWQHFETFSAWALDNGYTDHLFIDRKNNDRGYFPKNCRWVTHKESNRNTSRSKLTRDDVLNIKARLNERTASLAKEFGISNQMIRDIRNCKYWADVN